MFRQASTILSNSVRESHKINYLATSFVAMQVTFLIKLVEKLELNHGVGEARHLAWRTHLRAQAATRCFLPCSSKSGSSCRLLPKSGGLSTSADLGYRLLIARFASCSCCLHTEDRHGKKKVCTIISCTSSNHLYARAHVWCVRVCACVCVREERRRERERGRERERERERECLGESVWVSCWLRYSRCQKFCSKTSGTCTHVAMTTYLHYLRGYHSSRSTIAPHRKSYISRSDGGRIQHLYIPAFDPCSYNILY